MRCKANLCHIWGSEIWKVIWVKQNFLICWGKKETDKCPFLAVHWGGSFSQAGEFGVIEDPSLIGLECTHPFDQLLCYKWLGIFLSLQSPLKTVVSIWRRKALVVWGLFGQLGLYQEYWGSRTVKPGDKQDTKVMDLRPHNHGHKACCNTVVNVIKGSQPLDMRVNPRDSPLFWMSPRWDGSKCPGKKSFLWCVR